MSKRLKIGEVASLLGVSTETVREYTRKGIIKCHRLPSGWRVYDYDEVMRVVNELYSDGSE